MATATTPATEQDPAKATHLVVICHGLWGNPNHLAHLRRSLADAHQDAGLYILTPSSNKDNFTYDGIEVGAERITHEIEDTISLLRDAGAKLSKISIAGYSLGGLVARYVVGLLYASGELDELEPTNFTTFATPHLGVRTPRSGYRAQTWNWLGSRTLSTSGQQMFLTDNFRGTGKNLLSVMAEPESIFVRGLARFKNRSVYANTLNDRSVPYYTSFITDSDPYVDVDAIDVHPLPAQEHPVVLDPKKPVSLKKQAASQALSFREKYILSRRTQEALPFYAVLFTLLPLAVPLFLVNAGYQTYQSAQRIRLHESGSGSVADLKKYRVPVLEKSQEVQERVMRRLANERGPPPSRDAGADAGYLPTPPPETESGARSPSLQSVSSEESFDKTGLEAAQHWTKLALTDEQMAMISNLDQHVGFTKYPVHILKVRHTHAAIVVRTEKESFAEGEAVSAHWTSNFET